VQKMTNFVIKFNTTWKGNSVSDKITGCTDFIYLPHIPLI